MEFTEKEAIALIVAMDTAQDHCRDIPGLNEFYEGLIRKVMAEMKFDLPTRYCGWEDILDG